MKFPRQIISRFFFLTILIFTCSDLFCQLNINTAPTPAQMVQNILVGGGVTVSNITYTGGANSRAAFTNGSTTNLGLNSGIILSTSTVTQIANPASYFMNTNLGLAGDADLDAINSCLTYDACILEFDFVPMSDTVKFRYVFGSEEYPNYVCSVYNDIFAFFISGTNPSGGNYTNYNIALIPGTSLPVSVNSVNNGTPGGSYNSSGCTSLSYSNYYVDNAALGGATIAFGGFTTPLTAWCHVVPCQTYHIKLAVADGYNGLYDSGVFLEANSFTSNTFSVNTSYSNTALGTNATESCSQGIFSFILASPTSVPYTINYTINGTAANGADYTSIPGSVTIPAGQDSAGVTINPVFDGFPEGMETVIITYTNGCTPQTDTIYIADYSSPQVNLTDDTTICSGQAVTVTAVASGGVAPYLYNWNTGAIVTSSFLVSPVVTSNYIVTVTDGCLQTVSSDVTITVNSVSVSSTSSDENCDQSDGSVTANASGSCSSGYVYQWNTVPPETTQTVNNLPAGNYIVTVSCGSCTATATAAITNISGPSAAITSFTDANCGQSDGAAVINVTGGLAPYTYQWNSIPVQTTQDLQNAAPGNYTVTVTDGNGCTTTISVSIGQIGGPVLEVSSVDEICNQGNGSATVVASGGTGTYTYLWNTVPSQTSSVATSLVAGSYTVTVDDGMCSTTAPVEIGTTPGPDADISIQPPVTTLLDGPVVFTGGSSGNIVSWQWSFGDGSFGSGQFSEYQYNSLDTFTVTLIVTDDNGCTDTVVDSVIVKDIYTLYIPNAFTPDDDGKNDLFLPQGLNVYPADYVMQIYNRWGNMIFETKTWGEGWNGTKDNLGTRNDAVQGVYIYKITAHEINKRLQEYTGMVFLLK